MVTEADALALAAAAAAAKEDADARAALWALAVAVPNVKTLVPITLDLSSSNYSPWRGLFQVALEKYALDDHIRAPASSSSAPDAAWLRLDALVRSWLYGALSSELLTMVMDSSASAYSLWTRIEGLFRDNAETRAIYLEQEFHGLMQGTLSVAEYCRR